MSAPHLYPQWPPTPDPHEEAARLAAQRRRRRRIVFLVVGIPLLVVVVVVALALYVLHRIDEPAHVPKGFRAPSQLPRSGAVTAGAVLFDSDRSGSFGIYRMLADGSAVTAVSVDPRYDSWWPKLSPDRRTVVFYRTPAGTHDRDFSKTSLWAVAADGSGLRQLRPAGLNGWTFQGHAEFSPDGKHLVMFGGSRLSPQIMQTDPVGQHPVAVTHHRGGTNIDPSYSPNGRTIVFVGCPHSICQPSDYEIYRTPVPGRSGSGKATRLTSNNVADYDPYFAPDGKTLAWLTRTNASANGGIGSWNISLGTVRGSQSDPTGLSAVRLLFPGDTGITSKPNWISNSTLAFHRLDGTTFQLFTSPITGAVPRLLGRPAAAIGGRAVTDEYPDT